MTPLPRKLRFGMIGGGRGAFIGAVHRLAAQMDGQTELVAGAFSRDASRSRDTGKDLFLDPTRVYASYTEMAAAESRRPVGERLDFVVIVTPNHKHYGPAKLFLESGFNVVCDKPMTLSVAEARRLAGIVRRTRKVFVLTHNYTGNAMVKQARDLVRAGELGAVRKVVVEYPQGWLSSRIEESGQKQAAWRTDPRQSGLAGSIGDIGTHAANLVSYVTGLSIREVCADLTSFVPGRALDDDASVLLRLERGAKGVLLVSQISVGEENGLRLRVHGSKGSLDWAQEHPNELWVKRVDRPIELWRRGNPYVSPATRAVTRVPSGHPEGYLEAFANVYRAALPAIAAEVTGRKPPADCDYPTVEDGIDGMLFIETVVKSSRAGARWRSIPRR